TSSAPSVNQMRFFSSSALASAEKLRLAANCSAAETMVTGSRLRLPPRYGRIRPSPFQERRRFARLSGHPRPLRYLRWMPGTRAGWRVGPSPADNSYAAFSPPSALGARTLTLPPAFSTAATADFEAP